MIRRNVTIILKVVFIIFIAYVLIKACISYTVILEKWHLIKVPQFVNYPISIIDLKYYTNFTEGHFKVYLQAFFPRGIKAKPYAVRIMLLDKKGKVISLIEHKGIAFQGELIKHAFGVPLYKLNILQKYTLIIEIFYGEKLVYKRVITFRAI